MGIREDIKMLLAKHALTMTELTGRLGQRGVHTSVGNLSNKLKRGTIKFREVVEILDILGYDISYTERK